MAKVRVRMINDKECEIIVGEKPKGITWDRIHEEKRKGKL